MTHRVERTFLTTCSREAAFDHVADFSTTQGWDPGIPSAERIDLGPLGVGSTFRLVSRFGRTEQTLIYEITEYDRPNALTLVGDGGNFHGIDRITFVPADEGTTVTYVADLSLRGPARLAEPFIKGKLDTMSDDAVAGLRAALDALA
jgi:carbon monoxide dehydrogenase subunit G